VTFRIVGVLFVALLVAAGACTSDDGGPGFAQNTPRGRPTASDTLVIGLVGTMTGEDAWRGEDAFEGADLAVHRINVARDEEAPPFELVTRDDRGSPGRALRQIEELAGLPRTVGILYAGPPHVLPRAERALAGGGIPAMLIYGDLYGPRRLTQHVFQMAPSLVWQARRIVTYVFSDRRYETVGLLAGRSFSGSGAVSALREAVGDRGPEVVRYDLDETAFSPLLARLRRAHVEAIVVEGPPRVLSAVTMTLREMGSTYISTPRARLATASRRVRRERVATGKWHPQVVTLDEGLSPRVNEPLPAGTVASDSYARGAHYLPVPAFQRFRRSFRGWWGNLPTGWQLRAYDAVSMAGWAYEHADAGQDLASVLERLRRARFGGTEVTLGPDDHTAVDQSAVGIWTVPAASRAVPERERLPEAVYSALPWVPLARGFSIDGDELDFSSRDWRFLVRGAPPPQAPPPEVGRLKFGVATGRSDPIH
jgi:ABC-type branched-subunit amino acid transport system substrate-binding protein